MTRKCICQLCTCGRHRCPHNPRGIPKEKMCTISEYVNQYTPHQMEMRRSFKPDERFQSSSERMDDATTHRVDYIPHPLGEKYIRRVEQYQGPLGDMDTMTNYTKEFTAKPLEVVKPIKRDYEYKVTGKFEGEPTYQTDYRQWELQPREKVKLDAGYTAPSAPFQGNSNYQSDYTPHSFAKRQSMKPAELAKATDMPFEDATDYRSSYVQHRIPPREVREKAVWQPNTASMDDVTTHKRDFTLKEAAKQQSFKPDARAFRSEVPFEGDTTHRADFKQWQSDRPFVREAEKYKPPVGDMYFNTTHQTDFDQKPIERQVAKRPTSARRNLGKFDGTTNYQQEYQKWAMGERPQVTMKSQYVPNAAPFDGLPTYQRDYIAHQGAKRDMMKPLDAGYRSGAPFDDHTEYKTEYIKKQAHVCPAGLMLSGTDIGYDYREQDDIGHKWYESSSRVTYSDFSPGLRNSYGINSQLINPLLN